VYLYNRTFLELKVTELVNLNLANNLIRCVAPQAFLGLAELERLDLSGNNLIYIHPDIFNHNEKLFWLSLADNRFFTLPSQGLFFYGYALTFLDLSNCSVDNISQQIFKDTQKVRYLNLSNNTIRSIQPGTFGPLKQLRCLDISFNSLTSLHIDIFFRNISVGDYLSSDNLESCMEPESTPSVLKIKADNNPWHCDCKMKDFFEYISKQGPAFSGFICKEPQKYENISWKVLAEMDCTAYTSRNIEEVAEKPTSVLPRRSFYSTSPVTDVTEETATNIHMPIPTTQEGTFLAYGLSVVIILVAILVLINVIYIVARLRKHRRRYEQVRDNTRAALRGRDEERTEVSEM
jgi:hypothetical protein